MRGFSQLRHISHDSYLDKKPKRFQVRSGATFRQEVNRFLRWMLAFELIMVEPSLPYSSLSRSMDVNPRKLLKSLQTCWTMGWFRRQRLIY